MINWEFLSSRSIVWDFFQQKKEKNSTEPVLHLIHYQSLPVPNQKTTQPMFKVFRSTSTSPLSLSSGATIVLIRQGTCLRSEALKSRKLPPNGLQKWGGFGFPASVLGGRNLWQSCMIPGPTTTREESKWIWNDKNLYIVCILCIHVFDNDTVYVNWIFSKH